MNYQILLLYMWVPMDIGWDYLASIKALIHDKITTLANQLGDTIPYQKDPLLFKGLVWSAILPQIHYNNFTTQQAAREVCKRLNGATKNFATCTNQWYIHHHTLQKVVLANYHTPDPTHLSIQCNHQFLLNFQQLS